MTINVRLTADTVLFPYNEDGSVTEYLAVVFYDTDANVEIMVPLDVFDAVVAQVYPGVDFDALEGDSDDELPLSWQMSLDESADEVAADSVSEVLLEDSEEPVAASVPVGSSGGKARPRKLQKRS